MTRIIVPAAALAVLAGTALPAAAHPKMEMKAFSAATSATVSAPAEREEIPQPITGKVVQVLEAGGYTYLLIDVKGVNRWAAIAAAPVKVGETVTVRKGTVMNSFPSKTLNRTFDRIVFSSGLENQTGGTPQKSSAGSAGAAMPFSRISVEKAPGPNSYRIAELYASPKLGGKKVVVRGKVVKVSGNIMERNWIHLQDGSGSLKKKNHNLVVTSKEMPVVGDLVTVTGTLVRNKDFGSGYKYDVMVEQGKFTREEPAAKPAP